MAGSIFVRERRKVEDGEKKPRFRIIAVSDANVKVFAKHVRKVEIEQIAKKVGAEVIYLESNKGAREGSRKNAE